jgi:purine-binding chemotaxis protein CheW
VSGASNAPAGSERQLIVFSLHGEHYGLPIGSVREIIRYTPPRVTATARGLVRGMINLRGLVLPVLDLSERLGGSLEVTDATRILVLDIAQGVLGLIVDAVDGVTDVPTERITSVPGAGGDDALGDEIAAMDDRLIMVLDPSRALGHVLRGPEARDGQPGTPAPADGTPTPTAPAHGEEHTPSPRPAGPPPARRRSGATPQVPRRGRQRHPKDTEE